MARLNLQDDSGDREFFTILPNYVLNHSTAIDQALYCQMKRYAGEEGKCFATQETLMKKMGIGRKAFNKSLQYLLQRKWIEFVGVTGGKTRPIKTYKINNIWQENSDCYKTNVKIPAERTVSFQEEIPAKRTGDTGQKNSKIPAKRTVEEDPVLIRSNNKIQPSNASIAGSAINQLIDKFKPVNPSYGQIFRNTTQRAALQRMVKNHGLDRVCQIIEMLPSTNAERYAPIVTTPVQLENNMGRLMAFLQRKNREIPKLIEI